MQYYGTLGPACADEGVLVKMLMAGMTGIRLNLSHGDLEENGKWLDMLRRAADKCGVSPEILIDLRGPELRLGKLDRELNLEEGSCIWLEDGTLPEKGGKGAAEECSRLYDLETAAENGTAVPLHESVLTDNTGHLEAVISPAETSLPVPAAFLNCAEYGDHVLIDDGKIELELLKPQKAHGQDSDSGAKNRMASDAEAIHGPFCGFPARVIRGGLVKSEKSMAVIGKELPMPTLTESDFQNIRQASRYGVTGVMLPFVRNKEDLVTLRNVLKATGAGQIKIFAKIENMEGVYNLGELLPFADHVVIARGDLGNAMPLWELPGVQKRISSLCRAAGKPFMVVTQMLDSMHERAVPTRAEVSDIYNAVLDGAASLMLTGETAAGKYPVEAMEYLVKTGEVAVGALGEAAR